MTPLVSVITPAYNSAKYIGDTIDSIIAQEYTNWELIIINDNSTDQTVDIVSEYCRKDNRIILHNVLYNVGAAKARNIALSFANGQYVAFLDSDDIWTPQKLSTQLKIMQDNSWAFSFTAYEAYDNEMKRKMYSVKVPVTLNYRQYLRDTRIGCLTVIVNKSIVGNFSFPEIKSSHDMALWLNILKKGYIAHGIPQVLAYYRIAQGSITANKFKAAVDVWKVYRKFEKLSFILSAYNFCGYIFHAIIKRIKK